QGVLHRDARPRRGDRRDRTAGGQDAVRRRLVDVGVGGVGLDGRCLAAGDQRHPDAQDPHLRGAGEHGGAVAGPAGDRGGRGDPVRLHRDHGDHRGLRAAHPVRGAQQALAGRASGGVERAAAGAARGTPGDPAGPAAASAPAVDGPARSAQAAEVVTVTTDVPEPELNQLRLTARLNTSALDSRRGVVRLHPEAIAALGLREWDAVSLTGSRTTAAVVGHAPPGTPVGTALLDDVTLSNAGLVEDAQVLVAPVTVYGARSVTVAGSRLAS